MATIMNAPVDVLAYHDALIASHKALSADAFHVQELPKAEAARAAVAELIEAANEGLAMLDTFNAEYGMYPEQVAHLANLRAALARVGAA